MVTRVHCGTPPVVVQGVGLLVVDGVPQLHQVQLVLLHLDQPLAILLHPALDPRHLGVDVSLGLLHHEGLAKLLPYLLHRARDYIVRCELNYSEHYCIISESGTCCAVAGLLHDVRVAGMKTCNSELR